MTFCNFSLESVLAGCFASSVSLRRGVELSGALNSGRIPGSGPFKRAVRKKLTGKGWPGRSSRPQGAAVFERGRVRLEASAMAGSPSTSLVGISGRKGDEIADLIDLFSKTQYRAKEVSPRVSVVQACLRAPL